MFNGDTIKDWNKLFYYLGDQNNTKKNPWGTKIAIKSLKSNN